MYNVNQQKNYIINSNKFNRNIKRKRSVWNAIVELGFMKEGLSVTHGGGESEKREEEKGFSGRERVINEGKEV